MPTRRTFLAASSAALATPIVTASVIRRIDGGVGDGFPTTDPEVVQAVVGASHTNLDRVTELVTKHPELAKASWDWGFGDWENAIGACSHTARPDIAEFLMANGARPTLFTFTMLGQVDVVRTVCTANPGIQRTLGPHGTFTLMRHAVIAKQDLVVEYLAELGDADTPQPDLGITEAESEVFVGEYRPTHADTTFHIGFNDRFNRLSFRRDDRTMRLLHNRGGGRFNPAGAPSAQIVFDDNTLTIRFSDLALRAIRVPT